MQSKYRSSISNENLALESRCALSAKYTPDVEDVIHEKECKIFH